MNKQLKIVGIVLLAMLFAGCVPASQPNLGTSIGRTNSSSPSASISKDEYGAKPSNYTTAIQSYFSTKIARADESKFKYSQPKRAYKRKGLAYGGDIEWKGWLVETSIATPNRTGRLLTPKPYMVLFSGNQIVEDILGNTHKLLTKVDP